MVYSTLEAPVRRALSLVRLPVLLLAGLGVSLLPLCPPPAQAATSPRGLRLTVSSPIVDVGGDAFFTFSATSWPAAATVTLTFLAPHHGFTGQMKWQGSCSCFRLGVHLANRVHSLEGAHATAIVKFSAAVVRTFAFFQIRGLAPNGHDFAPGGAPILTAWVSDWHPFPGEYQHYCAWVHTVDDLGVPLVPVQFVVHFKSGTRTLKAGPTKSSGVACSHTSIGKAPVGITVRVDVYAGRMTAHTTFTPQP